MILTDTFIVERAELVTESRGGSKKKILKGVFGRCDEKNNNGRMFVAKNRNGPDGIEFPLAMDTSAVFIDVLEQEDDEVRSVVKSVAEQRKFLEERYKKFKNKKD